jgi:predicted acetyltransferase
MAEPSVRTITDDELGTYIDVVRTAFVEGSASEDEVEARRPLTDIARSLGAYDEDGRMCGAARAFGTQLTVPGGATVPCAAVTSVGVLPTHTRRGHLTRLMSAQLDDVAERGEPVAALIAAEYPIYGRYGYGPATEAVSLRIDTAAASWRDDAVGAVEIVDAETFAKIVEELYDRVRVTIPGHLAWDTVMWRIHAGLEPSPWGHDDKAKKATRVVWRDAGGEARAATSYQVDGTWERNRPAGKLTSERLVAADGRAEIEMLRYLTSIDWASGVEVWLRPIDEPAPLALVDGRAAHLADRSDHVWVRVVDVPAALAARTYAVEGSLVLEVADAQGHGTGRFRLEAGVGGATCAATTDDADLTVPVGALGAAYLGGTGWARLAAAGWVDEHRAGAVERATALFTSPRAPWCAMTF